MNDAIRLAGYRVQVCAPYIAKPKREIAKRGRELGVPIFETWSCYRGGEKPCGECGGCKKRERALE